MIIILKIVLVTALIGVIMVAGVFALALYLQFLRFVFWLFESLIFRWIPGLLNALLDRLLASLEEPEVKDAYSIQEQTLPISPFTGEPYDPAWGTIIRHGLRSLKEDG